MSNIPEPVCPRHPDRVSHLTCRRCGRPACPDCQRASSSTSFDCVDCVGGDGSAMPPATLGADDQARNTAGGATAGRTSAADDRGDRKGAHPAAGSTVHGVVPRRPQPLVTYGLIGLCVLIYLWQRVDPAVTDMGDFSAVAGYVEPWRFLTAAFLHSPDTTSHLLFNMLSLYTMGQFLEPVLGRAKFLALYLLSAFGGSVGCLLLAPTLDASDQSSLMAWFQGMVGASGAVFGLFTAAFFVLKRVGASVAGMVVLLAINVALPFFYPNISWQAHVGGAVVGLITAGLLYATARPGRERATWPVLIAVAIVLAVAAWAKYALNATVLDHLFAQAGGGIG